MADACITNAVWTAFDWLQVLGLGAAAGAIGQGIRTVVGLKKVNDSAGGSSKTVADMIEPSRLVVSLAIGAIAGALAGTTIIKNLCGITPDNFFAIVAAGYAGADFIEGFMSRVVPKADPAKPAPQSGEPTPAPNGAVG
ncbi:MAG: hypothetical protein WDN08_06610 [Rhizomicrobium sp.]